MHTILLSRFSPWPPNGGVQLRNWQNLSCVGRFSSVDLLVVQAEEEAVAPDLVGESLVLRPDTTPLGAFERRKWWFQKGRLPLAHAMYQQRAADWLTERIHANPGCFVILEEVFLAEYFDVAKRAGARVVFDAHNIEAVLRAQTNECKEGFFGDLRTRTLNQRMLEVESRLVRESDFVWVCSATDKRLMQGMYQPNTPIEVVPNTVSLESYESVRKHPTNRPGHTIAMTGTYGYPPNVEAAHFLIDELFPRLARTNPDTELILIGRDPQPFMLEAARATKNIRVTGPVASVNPFLEAADVLVAPLFTGSGTRLKIVEAFTAMRPVVSTAKGAEGIEALDGEHLFIREDADSMAAAIRELWSNPELSQRMVDNAFALANERYSWDAVEQAMRASLKP